MLILVAVLAEAEAAATEALKEIPASKRKTARRLKKVEEKDYKDIRGHLSVLECSVMYR